MVGGRPNPRTHSQKRQTEQQVSQRHHIEWCGGGGKLAKAQYHCRTNNKPPRACGKCLLKKTTKTSLKHPSLRAFTATPDAHSERDRIMVKATQGWWDSEPSSPNRKRGDPNSKCNKDAIRNGAEVVAVWPRTKPAACPTRDQHRANARLRRVLVGNPHQHKP